MNLDVDEAKGHFDEIQTKLSNNELLVVLLWRWVASEKGQRVYPAITDSFVNFAQPVAALRDDLHLLRGGWFNSFANCSEKPECGCTQLCRYEGEPINVKGVKERRVGPPSARAAKVEYAANFGGLVRMLKTSSEEMRQCIYGHCHTSPIARSYVEFIHRNLPAEERNAFKVAVWRSAADSFDVKEAGITEIQTALRAKGVNYYDYLLREASA
jgi:hypothetical protein